MTEITTSSIPNQNVIVQVLNDIRKSIALTDEECQEIVCALLGHSDIVNWMGKLGGYVHCARCDAELGDTLGSSYELSYKVIMKHDCKNCHNNFERLDWKHKFMTPDPFGKEGYCTI